ncbi:MAG: hypothetical protein EU544_00220 [Promethearchaeota archaeon]|nr:MAG: hypothetical protein EU544_00220 [Candidatus Lokiarchaeota archaeon]
MSRLDQHSAFGFLIFYPIYVVWTGNWIMDELAAFLIMFFSMCPDLDIFYGGIIDKGLRNLDETFQHHYFSFIHYPLLYVPLIGLFLLCLILDFFPLYFLIPLVGVYGGHFLPDTISCGDGIMWGKNPFKKDSYARFINVFCKGTDGYHGLYWDARYRQSFLGKIGNVVVVISVILLQVFQIYVSIESFPDTGISIIYVSLMIYLLISLIMAREEFEHKYLEEPPAGRYQDYRIDPQYIQGLNEKNRKRHLKKYRELLEENNIEIKEL